MGDALQFADSIAAFAILPAAFISLLALSLPPFEIACGLLLLWPSTRRVAALAIALDLRSLFLGAAAPCGARSNAGLRLLRDWRIIAAENVDRTRTERCARSVARCSFICVQQWGRCGGQRNVVRRVGQATALFLPIATAGRLALTRYAMTEIVEPRPEFRSVTKACPFSKPVSGRKHGSSPRRLAP